MKSVNQTVLDVFSEVTQRAAVTPGDHLVHDLLVDSLLFITLVVQLEARTEIKFADEDLVLELFPTVSDISSYLNNQKQSMNENQ